MMTAHADPALTVYVLYMYMENHVPSTQAERKWTGRV